MWEVSDLTEYRKLWDREEERRFFEKTLEIATGKHPHDH